MMSQKKPWKIFAILVCLFLFPAVLAKYLYVHPHWLPQHKTNHGQLITPPLELKQLSLSPSGHWILLFVQPQGCDTFCQKNLYTMQRIQRALGEDMDRVQRVLLTAPPVIDDAASEQIIKSTATSHWQIDLTTLNRVLGQPPAVWYIIDPPGNIILSYAANTHPDFILDDLKHLLGVSRID